MAPFLAYHHESEINKEHTMSHCPKREELELMLLGKLGPDTQDLISSHVNGCGVCQETVAGLTDGPTRYYDAPESENESRPENTIQHKIFAELREHPRYRVTGILGRGGMGTVYKAEHRLLDRSIVIKVIRPELLNHPQALQRFEREAKLAAKLIHPNIVTVYEAERLDKTQLLVMEFVEGVNLAELVSQRGLLPVAESCEIIRQVAIGLQHIHEQELVHRDIKPANLLVSPKRSREDPRPGASHLAKRSGK